MKKFISRVLDTGVDGYIFLAGLSIVSLFIFITLAADFISPYDPIKSVGEPLTPPNSVYLMGTDGLGRDVLSRVIHGSRTVMVVIIFSTLLSMTIGVPLGLVSGYLGGKLDRILSLLMDSIYAFPGLILAIAVASVLGPGIYNVALAIAVVYIPTYFRMIRGSVLSIKANIFIEAARALGASTSRILVHHILPNIIGIIAVVFTLNVTDAVLTEAGLSFLGLSVSAPTPDWGFDLKNGQRFLLSGYWWISIFPGISIVILALGFGLMGEGISRLVGEESVGG